MKKRLLIILSTAAILVSTVSAQNSPTLYTDSKTKDSGENLIVFRDRLVMDVFHTFWMNMPTEVDYMKFDPGFNFSAIWDFKMKNKPIAIGLGVGVTYKTQYSNAILRYEKDDDIVRYALLPENVSYNVLKMNYLSANIPIEFRYRHNNGFKFSIGARVGLTAHLSQKYKGSDPSTPSDTLILRNSFFPNKLKYNAEIYTRIGWKFVSVYYAFQPTPLFSDAKGPKIYPMSLGISLNLF